MAEEEKKPSGNGFFIFMGIIFLMAALNYARTGHIASDWSQYSVSSLSPSYGSSGSSATNDAENQFATSKATSPYKNRVRVENHQSGQDQNSEYLVLAISGSETSLIPITGWTLESSVTGVGRPIPKGVILPMSGSINVEQSIYVRGGDKVVLVSGRSPTGYSFRVNSCSGYFAQFQTFTPYLNAECIRPETYKLPTRPNRLPDSCLNYLEGLPRCFLPTATIPQTLSQECQAFVADNYNYNSCVAGSKDKAGFYKNEWRVYLNSGEKLWKNSRENIRVLDAEGRVVTSIDY